MGFDYTAFNWIYQDKRDNKLNDKKTVSRKKLTLYQKLFKNRKA